MAYRRMQNPKKKRKEEISSMCTEGMGLHVLYQKTPVNIQILKLINRSTGSKTQTDTY